MTIFIGSIIRNDLSQHLSAIFYLFLTVDIFMATIFNLPLLKLKQKLVKSATREVYYFNNSTE